MDARGCGTPLEIVARPENPRLSSDSSQETEEWALLPIPFAQLSSPSPHARRPSDCNPLTPKMPLGGLGRCDLQSSHDRHHVG